jgi:hypothetical protein
MQMSSAVSTQNFDVHLEGGSHPSEISWRIGEGTTFAYSAYPQTVSLQPGENILYMIDSFGDGWNGASWTLKEAGGEEVVAGPYTFSSGASATEMVTAWAAPTAAPTAVPTNVGDTRIPTASPTGAPTINISNILNWEALKTACGSMTSGTVALSADFVMGTYTPTLSPLYGGIDFSGKHLVIIGNSKTLDAGEKG